MENNEILVRRYTNRKLYSTNEKRYLTLAELAQYVRRGANVKVINYADKADITQTILMSAIWEQEKASLKKLPNQTLNEMIRVGSFTQYIQQLDQHA